MTGGTLAAAASDRALADWVEAEALVVALRRSSAAAAARAEERRRAAEQLLRAGRTDAFALGALDAADVLSQRAAAEARRLADAVRREEQLRARAALARQGLAVASGLRAGSDPEVGCA